MHGYIGIKSKGYKCLTTVTCTFISFWELEALADTFSNSQRESSYAKLSDSLAHTYCTIFWYSS